VGVIEILFKSLRDDSLKTLPDYKPGSWINIVNPDPQELEKAATDLGLDLITIKDALDPYETSRVEREEKTDYIFVRIPIKVMEQIYTVPLLIVMTPDYFITISKEPMDIIEKLKNNHINISTTQKTKLFITLLLDANSAYSHMVNEMRKKVRNFTIDVLKISNRDIIQLVDFESVFNDFWFSLEPLSLTFNHLLSGKYLQLFDADKDLVEDLRIGTDQLVKLCVSNTKAIANIREAYTSIISNNLNRTVKLLTAVTLILTIPTAIASFFGMNVAVPLSGHPFAFGFIVLLTLAMTTLVWMVLWKKDFI
jgi:magnesium transporter